MPDDEALNRRSFLLILVRSSSRLGARFRAMVFSRPVRKNRTPFRQLTRASVFTSERESTHLRSKQRKVLDRSYLLFQSIEAVCSDNSRFLSSYWSKLLTKQRKNTVNRWQRIERKSFRADQRHVLRFSRRRRRYDVK